MRCLQRVVLFVLGGISVLQAEAAQEFAELPVFVKEALVTPFEKALKITEAPRFPIDSAEAERVYNELKRIKRNFGNTQPDLKMFAAFEAWLNSWGEEDALSNLISERNEWLKLQAQWETFKDAVQPKSFEELIGQWEAAKNMQARMARVLSQYLTYLLERLNQKVPWRTWKEEKAHIARLSNQVYTILNTPTPMETQVDYRATYREKSQELAEFYVDLILSLTKTTSDDSLFYRIRNAVVGMVSLPVVWTIGKALVGPSLEVFPDTTDFLDFMTLTPWEPNVLKFLGAIGGLWGLFRSPQKSMRSRQVARSRIEPPPHSEGMDQTFVTARGEPYQASLALAYGEQCALEIEAIAKADKPLPHWVHSEL